MNIHSKLPTPGATTIESRLRARWAELLDVDAQAISPQSEFFSLGGNSMLLLSLHNFVSQEFRQDLRIPDLIQHAVFIQMVELLENGIPAGI